MIKHGVFPIEGDGHPPINRIYYSASLGLDSQYGIDDHKSFTKWHIYSQSSKPLVVDDKFGD